MRRPRSARTKTTALPWTYSPLLGSLSGLYSSFQWSFCDVRKEKASIKGGFSNRGWVILGCFNDFARLQAIGADAQPFGGAFYHGAHRAQVHVPAPLAHVVGVADLISKLRAFAADFAYSCHVG